MNRFADKVDLIVLPHGHTPNSTSGYVNCELGLTIHVVTEAQLSVTMTALVRSSSNTREGESEAESSLPRLRATQYDMRGRYEFATRQQVLTPQCISPSSGAYTSRRVICHALQDMNITCSARVNTRRYHTPRNSRSSKLILEFIHAGSSLKPLEPILQE